MKIPELKDAVCGDTATYFKHNIYMCRLRCKGNDLWYIEAMNGDWKLSDDKEYIAEGKLTLFNHRIIDENNQPHCKT